MEAGDEQLMLAYREGDAGAFEQLYQRHKGKLFRFVLSDPFALCDPSSIRTVPFIRHWVVENGKGVPSFENNVTVNVLVVGYISFDITSSGNVNVIRLADALIVPQIIVIDVPH